MYIPLQPNLKKIRLLNGTIWFIGNYKISKQKYEYYSSVKLMPSIGDLTRLAFRKIFSQWLHGYPWFTSPPVCPHQILKEWLVPFSKRCEGAPCKCSTVSACRETQKCLTLTGKMCGIIYCHYHLLTPAAVYYCICVQCTVVVYIAVI